jgi:RHS repeat-associated protein
LLFPGQNFGEEDRRVVTNTGTADDLYYSSTWQLLEERSSGTTQDQYVWSPVYIDALVERDAGSQRLYAQQDANWCVTALIDTTGTVQERYVYDPYGTVTVLTPSWGTRGTSNYAWVYLFQGGRFDGVTGLYNFRNRDDSPALGRWMQTDPIGLYGTDTNLYLTLQDSPNNNVDPEGLKVTGISVLSRRLWKGTCGSFVWFVDFELKGKTDKGGYIVQEVEATLEVKDCNGNPYDQHGYPDRTVARWHYLEAWYVPRNSIRIDYVAPPASFWNLIKKVYKKAPPPDFADVYWNAAGDGGKDCGPGTQGKMNIKGKVYFVDDLQKLPAAFKPGTGLQGAGYLPSVNLVVGEGKPDETVLSYFNKKDLIGPADHNLEATWKCCPKPEETHVSTVPPAE